MINMLENMDSYYDLLDTCMLLFKNEMKLR